MKSILEFLRELPQSDWDYYFDIDPNSELRNPFTEYPSHINFIKQYFTRGGKIDLIKSIDINISDLRLPNHINSVFFLGLLIYNKTGLSKKYNLGLNAPGYKSFPFIWFLIALFHDHGYEIESKTKEYDDVKIIDDLYNKFSITNLLLSQKTHKKTPKLLKIRGNYFQYRRNHCKLIDHGLLAGILLYDRLCKIREAKSNAINKDDDDLFWGAELEKQYALAADAISLHNIWLPSKNDYTTYQKYNLGSLIKFKPIQFKDFELFYLLGIIDTIDPIKTFSPSGVSDEEILNSLLIEFSEESIIIINKPNSKLDFNKLIGKTVYFHGWLDVSITFCNNYLKITFR